MIVSSVSAAKVCNISRGFFIRACKALGLKHATRTANHGGKENVYGIRHVLAVSLVGALERVGFGEDAAFQVATMIGQFPSDEQLEATLGDRSWVLYSEGVATEFLNLETVRRIAREHGDALVEHGFQISAIDLQPLFHDIRQAILTVQRGRVDA